MLVLTRKQNEKLHIGDDIVITIVRARGNSIRIGIEAPTSVNIRRGELAGLPEEQTPAPKQQRSSTESVDATEQPKNGHGPLSRFLKVLPKVELAIAS